MENLFAIYDLQGRIRMRSTVMPYRDERQLEAGEARDPGAPLQTLANEMAKEVDPSYRAVPIRIDQPMDQFFVLDGVLMPLPQKPGPQYEFNFGTHTWDYRPGYLDSLWKALKQVRDTRQLDGGVKVGDVWFHSDLASRAKYTNVVLTDSLLPSWKAMGGVYVEMTATLARAVLQAIADNDDAVFAVANAHRGALEASDAPEQYDWYAGWPLSFAEAQTL